jgi:hypothetical protein
MFVYFIDIYMPSNILYDPSFCNNTNGLSPVSLFAFLKISASGLLGYENALDLHIDSCLPISFLSLDFG